MSYFPIPLDDSGIPSYIIFNLYSSHLNVLIFSGPLPRFLLNLPEDSKDRRPIPCETTLNLDTGEAFRAKTLPGPVTEGFDFPQIRRSLLGRKARFGYCAGYDKMKYPTAVVKLDLQVREA